MISFNVTIGEANLIRQIVDRALLLSPFDKLSLNMDITACHCNCCSLDLKGLLNAPDSDFAHDVAGINRRIDYETGKLENCFLPRYARREDHG